MGFILQAKMTINPKFIRLQTFLIKKKNEDFRIKLFNKFGVMYK